MKIIEREIAEHSVQDLVRAGVNPLLARLYVARGVQSCDELDTSLSKLLPPSGLKGIHEAARILADAIAAQRSICIVADYDCDGATACAVGVRGLRMLGAQHVTYEVPDRIQDGYGLSAPSPGAYMPPGMRCWSPWTTASAASMVWLKPCAWA